MTTMTSGRMSEMGMGMGSMGGGMMMPGMTGGMGMGMGMMPRCKMTMMKMEGGMKMMCVCDDAMQRKMMQNLMGMMAGGMMSCCMMMNGMPMMTCSMMMAKCTSEMTAEGCVMMCTSGDMGVMQMIQACCDCMSAMMAAGCCCCVMMNGMGMCCSC